MIEPVIEPLSGDGDAQVGHVGEIRQTHPARLMDLAEDDLLVRAMQRPPGTDAPLQGAARTGGQVRMAPLHLVEDRHRPQPRRRRQHRHDLGIEELGERIGTASAREPAAAMTAAGGPARSDTRSAVLIAAFAALTAGPSVCRKVM